ncbi:TPA: elongation factor Ts [bacterium]|nr:elongation factor Ts [bacterium]
MNLQLIKELRERSGAGILDCKNALDESKGEIEKAIIILREKGLADAQKLETRETKEGAIFSYIHQGSKLGVMLELNCETDFVARTEEFKVLGKELCLQIAALNPLYIKPEDIPPEKIEQERNIVRKQFEGQKKPENVLQKIIEGRLSKFYEEICLLNQPYIRDPQKKINDLILESQAKIKEKISISRFIIFRL